MNQEVLMEIKNTNKVICDNIEYGSDMNRGLLSQNILAQLRNLVEDFCVLVYNKKNNSNLGVNFDDKKTAYKRLNETCKPKFLMEFHSYLQSSKSHYTTDFDGAERLMLKYYHYMILLKEYSMKEFNIEILDNIEEFPLDQDDTFYEYYKKISNELEQVEVNKNLATSKERYYVQKIKPFYVDNKVYYEVTLTNASDVVSKFERIVLFTKCRIMKNYAITISFVEKEIDLFDKKTKIKIINNWNVSIRSCEFRNFAKIFSMDITIRRNMNEYLNIMKYMTENEINLLDLCVMPDSEYTIVKEEIGNAKTNYIFDVLEKCRNIIINNSKCANVLRYLLYTMNNSVIKLQLESLPQETMNNLCIKRGCYPFEKCPWVFSLCHHNPKGENLFFSIGIEGRDDELLARFVRFYTEFKGDIYISLEKVSDFDNIESLVETFNSKLFASQESLKLIVEKNNIYMLGYEIKSVEIIKKLNELTTDGIEGYTSSFEFWELNEQPEIFEEKREILANMYENSRLAMIYGAAGTGKSTLISIFSNFFDDKTKIYLTNTNTAKENLGRRVKAKNTNFMNIAEFLSNGNFEFASDVLIIDECSMVSNNDMIRILNKAEFKLLMLVGDIYQIESILFGNWFYLAKEFVDKDSVHELATPFRTENEDLLVLWGKIRNKDTKITEYLNSHHYSKDLDSSIMIKESDDEIILCLNYDGLYGINQINKYLQDCNPNKEFTFGINTYKVGDPVLFCEVKRFSNILYNNLKGIISNIVEEESKIWFEIEIEKPLTELDVNGTDVELVEITDHFTSIIRFYVDKEFEHEDDDDEKNNVIPFNVAYALSIHKAQGLEYDSVKVVITNDVEDMITSNIFYTAVTRSKDKLKIYWTPETQDKIISIINEKKSNKDFNILKNKYNL